MWRAVTEGEPFLSGRSMISVGHFGRRMVVYPISRRHEERGRALINWVAEFKIAGCRPMPVQDRVHTARLEDALAPFAAFLDVPALIRGAATIYQHPMADRDPLPTWDFGRITLLGDAAHSMHPTGGNGASQAILDTRVLARELALRPPIEAAVAAYDAARRPAAAAAVVANRAGGPERPLELVEERAPDGFANIDDVVSREELEEIARAYMRTAGFDPETLNNRPSPSVRSAISPQGTRLQDRERE
jgi:2-polyprenyl-6-methoxyphenol hydroxylase-like FAD-dependent oxidoreductase